ncbi:MAG: pyridoxal 5'-phosphate synthase glutaminase subunit PdxT [Acidimicrobiales bacterium]
MAPPVIGVLGLQGDVAEHLALLTAMGVAAREVTSPEALGSVDGIVLPGGESTTMSLLLESSGLTEPLRRRIGEGMPVLGTCAGMILLAAEVLDGRSDQVLLGAIDISVRRNGFGRQVQSFEADVDVMGAEAAATRAVFIRAPVVERTGAEVEVLATLEGTVPVACRQGNVIVAAFHPELSGDTRLHEMLLEILQRATASESRCPSPAIA